MKIVVAYNEQRGASEAQAEFDTPETIEALGSALRRLGHAVRPVEVSRPVEQVASELRSLAPELVFNLAEGERGRFREAFFPALYEQLGLAYTGSSPSVLALCLDKTLAKRVVAAAGVVVAPDMFATSAKACTLAMPVIVKPNFEGSSKGIRVVASRSAVAPAIASVLEHYPAGVLVEEYIEGIDVTVSWVAGIGLLAPIRYAYERAGAHPVFDRAAKIPGVSRIEVAELAPAVNHAVRWAATRAFAALGVTGYGRADFRVTPEGEVVFLEMNPLPSLAFADNELYRAAALLGKTPDHLIAAIVAGFTMK